MRNITLYILCLISALNVSAQDQWIYGLYCDSIGAPITVQYAQYEKDCCYQWDNKIKDLVQIKPCPTLETCNERSEDCCRTNFPVNTDRNGLSNPFFYTDFIYGDLQADNWNDLVGQITSNGGVVTLECINAECHKSFIDICGLCAPNFSYVDSEGIRQNIRTKCSLPLEFICVEWEYDVIPIDNTFTRFNQQRPLFLTFENGDTCSVYPNATTGWSAQTQEWERVLELKLIDHDPTGIRTACNRPGGCGGLLPPPTEIQPDLDCIFARYLQVDCCPDDPAIVDVQLDGPDGKHLVMKVLRTKKKKGWLCIDKENKSSTLLDSEFNPVPPEDIPPCWYTCGSVIPDPPEAKCDFVLDTEACDNMGTEDVSDDVSITKVYSNCDGKLTFEYMQEVNGTLDPYTLVGENICSEPVFFENDCESVGVNIICFEEITEGEEIKLSSSATDCDPGASDPGTELCGTATVAVDANILSIESFATDNSSVTITLSSISGNQAIFKYCWINDGSNVPNGNISVTGITDKGIVVWNTADNSDFRLCSGGRGSYLGNTLGDTTEIEIKEICFDGCPSKFQDQLGNEVNVSNLNKCKIEKQEEKPNYVLDGCCYINNRGLSDSWINKYDNSISNSDVSNPIGGLTDGSFTTIIYDYCGSGLYGGNPPGALQWQGPSNIGLAYGGQGKAINDNCHDGDKVQEICWQSCTPLDSFIVWINDVDINVNLNPIHINEFGDAINKESVEVIPGSYINVIFENGGIFMMSQLNNGNELWTPTNNNGAIGFVNNNPSGCFWFTEHNDDNSGSTTPFYQVDNWSKAYRYINSCDINDYFYLDINKNLIDTTKSKIF